MSKSRRTATYLSCLWELRNGTFNTPWHLACLLFFFSFRRIISLNRFVWQTRGTKYPLQSKLPQCYWRWNQIGVGIGEEQFRERECLAISYFFSVKYLGALYKLAVILIFDSLYIPYPFGNKLIDILSIDWYDLIHRLQYQDLLCKLNSL